uniref:Uncharacterized protein n=1 Tax=Kalanchoe fedtschenkoi TaxID=63787 RepID=A0A7N0TUY9_KALFE
MKGKTQRDDDSLSSSSSSSDSESEAGNASKKAKNDGSISKGVTSGVKKKSAAIGFEALKRHGYKGGLSVLKVPAPKEDSNQDWSWSTGRENGPRKDIDESYKERQETRAKLADAEQLTYVQTRKDKNLSFSQKEKRKRDLGQASRGKNYVEEEKRMLRDSGVYSGFDS